MSTTTTSSTVPEACPGTSTESAGKASACQGCPNQTICAAGPAPPDPAIPIITQRLAQVTYKLLILSGKGGVGKSTFSTNLAFALSQSPIVTPLATSTTTIATDSLGNDTLSSVEDNHDKSFQNHRFHSHPSPTTTTSTSNNIIDTNMDEDGNCFQVGLMDIDICGPSLPRMTGLLGETIHSSMSGWSPVYVNENLAVMSIGFMLPNQDEAVIWRGPKKNGLIKQFLKDVDWGQLDFLLVDTPPGTSDEHLSIVQYMKESGISGAIIITTPQQVSLADVRKEINFCKKVGIPVIGVVENMCGFVCPSCNKGSIIFPNGGGSGGKNSGRGGGGAKQMALDMNVPYLGSVPLDPRIAKSTDLGLNFLEEYPESAATKSYMSIIEGKEEAIYCLHVYSEKLCETPLLNRLLWSATQKERNCSENGASNPFPLAYILSPSLWHYFPLI